MSIKRVCSSAIILVTSAALFMGCASLREGNKDEDVAEAIRVTEELYDTQMTLKEKTGFPRGVACDVTVTCADVPGKDIRVYRSSRAERVTSDYIYQKYGDEAYEKIMGALRPVVPDAKIVIMEFNYNHFPLQDYDAGTTLEDYLLHNDFHIYVYKCGDIGRGELRMIFGNCANALIDAGVDCKELDIFSCDSKSKFNSIKEYSYIPENMEYSVPTGKIKGQAQSSSYDGLRESMKRADYDGHVNILMKD